VQRHVKQQLSVPEGENRFCVKFLNERLIKMRKFSHCVFHAFVSARRGIGKGLTLKWGWLIRFKQF
jgi:hypothetical protein